MKKHGLTILFSSFPVCFPLQLWSNYGNKIHLRIRLMIANVVVIT